MKPKYASTVAATLAEFSRLAAIAFELQKLMNQYADLVLQGKDLI